MKHILLFGLLGLIGLTSCKKDYVEIDADLIQQYISDNGLNALEASEGLWYTLDSAGTGDTPNLGDEVTVDYEGFLLDGTKFDSSLDRGQPAVFPLAGVIRGWQIGIPKFKEGGGGKLLVPSGLGYGDNPPSGGVIGKNEVLVFDVHLISVN